MIDNAAEPQGRNVGLAGQAPLGGFTESARRELAGEGFAVVPGDLLGKLVPAACEPGFTKLWDELEPDAELCDGGCYRFRRYGRLRAVLRPGGYALTPLPHAPFRQDATYLPGYQGRQRHFAPIPAHVLSGPAISELAGADLAVVSDLVQARQWVIGLHMIRVVAEPGAPGLPTPEGRHRDGHDYIGMHLIGRSGCAGGESVIYRDGRAPHRTTLATRLDSLLVDDGVLTHEVTPIAAVGAEAATRDTLLIDLNVDHDGQ
jgi:hypothetical protein